MKYKQEFLNCYERKETREKIKAIIKFIEYQESEYNKDIAEFKVKELGKVLDNIKEHKVNLDGIEVSKVDIIYQVSYYLELVKELEEKNI